MADPENVSNRADGNSGPTVQIGALSGGINVDGGLHFGASAPDGGFPFADVAPPGRPEGCRTREGLVDEVVAALGAGPGARLLQGPAGVGTSALAAAVAERIRRDRAWPVYWIRPGQRLHGLLRVACMLRPDREAQALRLLRGMPAEGIAWAREVIGEHRRPALIVIDGADGGSGGSGAEAAVACGWDPMGGACRVLLTSRSPSLHGVGPERLHSVPALEPGAAYRLLHEHYAPRDAREGRVMEEAAASCRGLPGRLLATAAEMEAGADVEELARQWRWADELLGAPDASGGGTAGGREAVEILAAVGADQADEGVPFRWCGADGPHCTSPGGTIEAAVSHMERNGVLAREGHGPMARVRLAPEAARYLRMEMGHDRAAEVALDTIEFWSGHEIRDERDALERVSRLYPDVPGVRIRADVEGCLVELESAGRDKFVRALRRFDRVLRAMAVERPVCDGDLRAWRRARTGFLWARGIKAKRWPKAEMEALRDLAAEQTTDMGADHRDTLRSETVQFFLLMGYFEDEAAEEIHTRIMRPLVRAFGEDHQRVLGARLDRASVHGLRGEYAEMIVELRDIAGRCEDVLSPDHPICKDARHMLSAGGMFNKGGVPVVMLVRFAKGFWRLVARRFLY